MTGVHPRLVTALADRYLIERELGAGGMATVYLAQDLKHHRKVAVKVLRPELAAVIGAERFLTEIRTTANLQHPHILPLFDSGEADSFLYYVMPFIEGESLRNRLDREKQLPIQDSVRLATEIASALDYAHRHGVIHRDIKPENILLHDGSALVADFGIALAASKASGSRMTETGMSLGTPHYMSPEQAMGEREIGPQSDVYALGAVTYEMLVGEPPFTGPTAQSIVAKVVTEEPRPLVPKRHTIPPHVEAATLMALEKLPADRFASAAEFAEALNGRLPSTSRFTATQAKLAGAAPGASRKHVLTAFVLGVFLATLAAALWMALRPAPTRPPLLLSVWLPKGEALSSVDGGTRLALSPDGTKLAYVGPGEGGGRIWLRRLDQLHAAPIPGTEGGRTPFFSPDGERLGFFSGNRLQILSLNGGPPTMVTDTGFTIAGGTWSRDDYIYFDANIGIGRISLRDRTRELIYRVDSTAKEQGVAWPQILRDGKTLIFRLRHDITPGNFDIVAMKVPGGKPKVVVRALYACFSPSGDLVYVTSDGTLFSAPFDTDKLALSGPAVAIATGLSTGAFGAVDMAISENGALTYTTGAVLQSIVGQAPMWVDRQGIAVPIDSGWHLSTPIQALALSPDGRALAVSMPRNNGIGSDVWIKRLDTGTLSRLTFDRSWNDRPVWVPGGRSVAFVASDNLQNLGEIRMKRADGSASDELVASAPSLLSDVAFSRDGQWLLVRTPSSSQVGANIGAMRRGVPDSIHWILDSRFNETTPALSPDGRWLAYASNETGSFEVYVRPFPEVSSAKWQVSSGGGSGPLWSHSGRELFYVSGGDLKVVDVRPGREFSISPQRSLFPMSRFAVDQAHWFYAIAPNDRRFVMYGAAVGDGEGTELILAQNWKQSLGKQ